MSYGVVRVQKFTAGSIKGIEIHDRREKYKSHSNPDIDFTKSKFNYDIHHAKNQNFRRAANEIISQLNLSRAVRKDAIVMAQVLVTSDKTFFDGLSRAQQDEFFKDSYNFLADRYGKKNVISATVHYDEKTPHMHFNFVPITADGRLSAKSVLTRTSLTQQQDAFHNQVGRMYGLKRGEVKGSGKRRTHLETDEYKKMKTMYELEVNKLENIQRQINDLEAIFSNKSKTLINIYENQKRALEGKFDALERHFKGMELTAQQLNDIQPQKSIWGDIKGVSLNDIESLKKMALSYVQIKHEYDMLDASYKKLYAAYEAYKKQIPSIPERTKQAKDMERLKQLENVFEMLPVEVIEQLIPSRPKGLGQER